MKLSDFHHGDFVCWRRPDRSAGQPSSDDVRAGSLAHGRVIRATVGSISVEKKKMSVKEALGNLSPEQAKIVKTLGCFGIPEIEKVFDEWAESDKEVEISEPTIKTEEIFVLMEIKPGVCKCGCGGNNYVEVESGAEELDLRPEAGVALQHNSN